MLLQRQKQTTCLMIQLKEVLRKQQEMQAAVNYETVTYEGYGPNGIAIIVDALTDNRNRTAANVRNCISQKVVEM